MIHIIFCLFSFSQVVVAQNLGVLVFSKTTGFRHSSIDEGIAAIQSQGSLRGWSVTATEDSADFNTDNLANFDVVVFLNTSSPSKFVNKNNPYLVYPWKVLLGLL